MFRYFYFVTIKLNMSRIKINYTTEQLVDIANQKQIRKLANRVKRKALKTAINKSEWKELKGDEGTELPDNACIHHSIYDTDDKGCNIFQYGGNWLLAYYKGNPVTTSEWIIVTNNAGYYKRGTEYMIWHPNGSQACVSYAATKKSVKSLITIGSTIYDPKRGQFT